MNIKSILYIFDGREEELSALNAAFALAKLCSAQLRILHITSTKMEYWDGRVYAQMMPVIEEENKLLLKKAQEYSSHYAELHHVALDSSDTHLHCASARFIHRTGLLEDIISREGRMSDLIIAGRNPYARDALWDASLFSTGRPVIMTPCLQGIIPTQWQHKVISIAWNGTLEAARAVYNAMPFLETAEKVHILAVRKHNEEPLVTEDTPVMDYLAAHGISSDVIIIDRQEQETGEVLLTKAKELQSELVIMGAYGHSRVREMILGGVTNYMLEESTIPLLLSH